MQKLFIKPFVSTRAGPDPNGAKENLKGSVLGVISTLASRRLECTAPITPARDQPWFQHLLQKTSMYLRRG